MPDADGRIRGIAVPAAAWERIFGTPEEDEAWGEMERRAAHNAAIDDMSWPTLESE